VSVDVVVLLGNQTELTKVELSWHEPNAAKINHLRWANLPNEIAEYATAQENVCIEVYLLLKGDDLVVKPDSELLEQLLVLARGHTWGARIYVVLDQSIFKNPEDLRSNFPLIAIWLTTVLEQGATDVLLLNHSRFKPELPAQSMLRRAADESLLRMKVASNLVGHGMWHCWAVPRSSIGRFIAVSDSSTEIHVPHRNFLIALDRKAHTSVDELSEIEKFLKRKRGTRCVLSLVGIGTSEIPPSLLELAKSHSLPIIRFRGWIEFRLLFLRINHLSIPYSKVACDSINAISAIAVERTPIFSYQKKTIGGLLITSGFNYQHDAMLCRETASDIGKLLYNVSSLCEYQIQPSFKVQDLRRWLLKINPLLAWWFIGHGRGSGLQDAHGQIYTAQEWLKQCSGLGRRLPLVFFSACRSDEIARAFAQAGAEVAIGFDSETLTAPCRMLAIKVLGAALDSAGDRNAILTAFSNGCRDLQVQGLDHVKPRAFYGLHN
jgi:hypothetical protein